MDPVLLALPHSGLVIRFPIGMGLNPDGSANLEAGTTPDWIIPEGQDALTTLLDSLRK